MGELFKLLGLGLFFTYNDGENAQKGGGCLLLTILFVGAGLIYLINCFLKSDIVGKDVKDVIVTVLMVILIPTGIYCLWKFIKYSIEAEKEKNR